MRALFALLLSSTPAEMPEPPAVTYPRLPQAAPSEAAIVPAGWKIVERDAGDLNGDGRGDLALLLKMDSKANLLAIPDSSPPETLDTNPFLLAIAFAEDAGGYRLAASTHGFFARTEFAYSGDIPPGEGDSMRIERGTLLLSNEYLRGHDSFRFRWEKGAFRLIGYETGGSSGGCAETISINYLTGKVRWENTPIRKDKGVAVTRRVKPGPLPTLESFDRATFIPSDTIAGEAPPCDPQ